MTDNYLNVHIEGEVAVLTLNRPDKLNAMDASTRVRLAQTIRRFGTGDVVRGIVLTGTGRAFSAGEDLQTVPTTYPEIRDAFATFHDITRAILETRVPVIAAVNGIAVGGGVGPYRGPQTETVRVTSDGGATWYANTTSIGPRMLHDIHFPTRQDGFAAGGDQILKLKPDRASRF